MAMNDQEKKRFVAIARRLKDQKGITIKHSEVGLLLGKLKQGHQDVSKVKEQYKDVEAVYKEADTELKKIQDIINDLNEYMSILHPTGLIDFGSGKGGKQVVSHG